MMLAKTARAALALGAGQVFTTGEAAHENEPRLAVP